MVGDLLKVFHFRSRNRNYFMYHVAVMEDTKDFPVLAGADYTTPDKPHYRMYVICLDSRVFVEAIIVHKNDWKSKRLKIEVK